MKDKQIHLRADQKTIDFLVRISQKKGVSISAMIRIMIDEYAEKEGIKKPDKKESDQFKEDYSGLEWQP